MARSTSSSTPVTDEPLRNPDSGLVPECHLRNGSCAALYRQSAPLVNACRRPGESQTFDIMLCSTPPICAADGTLETPGSLTMLHNSVLVQNHVRVRGRRFLRVGWYYCNSVVGGS